MQEKNLELEDYNRNTRTLVNIVEKQKAKIGNLDNFKYINTEKKRVKTSGNKLAPIKRPSGKYERIDGEKFANNE